MTAGESVSAEVSPGRAVPLRFASVVLAAFKESVSLVNLALADVRRLLAPDKADLAELRAEVRAAVLSTGVELGLVAKEKLPELLAGLSDAQRK